MRLAKEVVLRLFKKEKNKQRNEIVLRFLTTTELGEELPVPKIGIAGNQLCMTFRYSQNFSLQLICSFFFHLVSFRISEAGNLNKEFCQVAEKKERKIERKKERKKERKNERKNKRKKERKRKGKRRQKKSRFITRIDLQVWAFWPRPFKLFPRLISKVHKYSTLSLSDPLSVSLSIYICIYIYIYIRLCTYIYIYIYIYGCRWVRASTCLFTRSCVSKRQFSYQYSVRNDLAGFIYGDEYINMNAMR